MIIIPIIYILLLIVTGAYQTYIIFDNFSSQWHLMALAMVYTITINDIFCHRICAHNMFEVDTKTITYKILTFLSCLDFGYGPNLTSSIMHQLHHKYSDKGIHDIMNWRYHFLPMVATLPFPMKKGWQTEHHDEYKQNRIEKFKHITKDTWTVFCRDNQLYLSVSVSLLLYIFVPSIFFLFCVSRFMLLVMTILAGLCGHIKNFPLSYRNHKTNDQTSNNLIFHYLFLGYFSGMLQNNHHGRPKAVSPNSNWYEIDTSKPVILLFKKLMEKKIDK